MRSRSPNLAAIMLGDPETMRIMMDAMAKKAGSDKSAFAKALEAAGLTYKPRGQ
jgi:hypothetical protein